MVSFTYNKRTDNPTFRVFLDPYKWRTIEFSTVRVVGLWRSLVFWTKKHAVVLAANGLRAPPTSAADSPNGSSISLMCGLVAAVIQLLGVVVDKRVQVPAGAQRGKRARLGQVVAMAKQQGWTEPPTTISNGVQVTMAEYQLNEGQLFLYLDVGLRKDMFDLVINGDTALTKCHAYIYQGGSLTTVGPANPKSVLAGRMMKYVKDCEKDLRPFFDSPSWWLVRDERPYSSLALLYRAISRVSARLIAFWGENASVDIDSIVEELSKPPIVVQPIEESNQ